MGRQEAAKQRARELLKQLSLEEKLAQVNCLFPYGDNDDMIARDMRNGIGQVSTLDMRMLPGLEDAACWQRDLQQRIMENSPHQIPAIFHMEGLCGAFLQGAASFPSGIGRGAGFNPALEEQIGAIVARQELACGITQVLAPVLDISMDSRMGRQGESYGEDPSLAAALGSAYTKGVQETVVDGRNAESAAKHFAGFHGSMGGIHGANCEISDRLFQEVYCKPFQAAIAEAGLRGIMPCYCSINGIPASASRTLLTDLLREDMGFDGVCVSDYGAVSNVYGVQHVAESPEEAGLLCMEAGMDVEMQTCVSFNHALGEMFRSGRADMEILDGAVLRVLEAKFRMGLFEHPFALCGEELRKAVLQPQDASVSLQSALESLVLLKNNGVLPLSAKVRKIALIGCHAGNARSFFGGYTHVSMVEAVHAAANSIAGLKSGSASEAEIVKVPGTEIQSDETEEFDAILRRLKPDCRNLSEELQARLSGTEIIYAYGYPIAGDDCSHHEEALQAVREADLVICTLGGKHGSCSVASMGEGVDATDINLPVCQDVFLREAAKLGKPMVGIHFNGRPISSDAADECLDAILEAWNPSEWGAKAIVSALLGEYNPGGKLPVTVARCAGQLPVCYNHPNGSSWHQGDSIGFANYVDLSHKPRYCFGHGLSYTDFAYENLEMSAREVLPSDTLEVSVSVTNTGETAGEEVVQLYLRDEKASVMRPVKELAGFLRICLEPGEHKKVVFSLPVSQTAFLDRNMKWKMEKGKFEVQVGSSSEDIRLTDSFCILEDGWCPGRERSFYAGAKAE